MHIYSVFNKLFQDKQEDIDTNIKINKENLKEQESVGEKIELTNKKNNCYALFPKDGNCFLGLYNNDKKIFQLSGLEKFSSNKFWVKKANDFLSDKLTKKTIYLEFVQTNIDKDLVVVYLDKEKTKNLNQELLNQDFSISAEKYLNAGDSVDKEKSNKSNGNEKNKTNNCYALFPKDGNLFLGMFNNEKRTFELQGLNHLAKNKNWVKESNYFLKEKLSKKIVYLEFPEQDNNDLVVVYLDKEKTKNLNAELLQQHFSKNISDGLTENINEKVIRTPKINNTGNWDSSEDPFFEDIADLTDNIDKQEIVKAEPIKNSDRWSSTSIEDNIFEEDMHEQYEHPFTTQENKPKRFPK